MRPGVGEEVGRGDRDTCESRRHVELWTDQGSGLVPVDSGRSWQNSDLCMTSSRFYFSYSILVMK